MADTLRPASLLIGAICLWAVSIMLLAFAGLGANVADSGLKPAPPEIPRATLTATRSRLGPLLDYAQVGERPLLNQDRRPAPVAAAAGGSDELDVVLTSVLITPRLQVAILTDAKDQSTRRVHVGDNVQGTNWRLASLAPRSATLDGPTGQRTLELRVYDGQGGEPPTAVAGAPGSAGSRDGIPGAMRPDAAAAGGNDQPANASNDRNGATPTGRPPIASAGAVRPAPTPTPTMQPPPTTQDAQIEAIRRRIEARRAQMRAEAEAAGNQNR